MGRRKRRGGFKRRLATRQAARWRPLEGLILVVRVVSFARSRHSASCESVCLNLWSYRKSACRFRPFPESTVVDCVAGHRERPGAASSCFANTGCMALTALLGNRSAGGPQMSAGGRGGPFSSKTVRQWRGGTSRAVPGVLCRCVDGNQTPEEHGENAKKGGRQHQWRRAR